MTDLPSLLYSETETDLRAVVRDFLDDRSPATAVLERVEDTAMAAVDRASPIWKGLATDLVVTALPLPAEIGGVDATWLETAVVLEELGRAISDVPFFTSAVMATALARAAGADALLTELAAGTAIAAVAVPFAEPLGWSRTLTRDGRTVSGRVPAVAGAVESTYLLVPARDALLLVPADQARVTPVVSLDMTRRVADVEFSHAEGTVIAEGPAAVAALEYAALISSALLASEQLGIAEHVFAATVDYLCQRRQFGRVIGSYQALKHRVADTWTALIQARAVARYAAACAAGSTSTAAADLPVAASLAQAVCGPVAVRAAEECIQLHGGIGFTWELPAHLYLKRARADALALGTPAWHRHHLAGLVGLTSGSEQGR